MRDDCDVSAAFNETVSREKGIDEVIELDESFESENDSDATTVEESFQKTHSVLSKLRASASKSAETEGQRRRRVRLLQRSLTDEIGTLDLIDNSNRTMRQLLRSLGLNSDEFSLVMNIVSAKDKELIRLRRELVRTRDILSATKKNIIPRLRSKAHQARVLLDATKATQTALQNQRHLRGVRAARALIRET